ncbi:ATPase AAA [Fibrobacterales bacterium]|nr:ATPase AAA [Fibrobacterales bacterium]
MDKPKRYPLGIQTFSTIREDNYHYVDKTARIHDLVTGSGYVFFLSRPRRFGKSLLCSTLGALFEGQRELFKGLAIDSLTWEWKKYPVIRIDLNPGSYASVDDLFATQFGNLESNASRMALGLRGETISEQLRSLIEDAHNKFGEKVAVIIDEYDKPLLSTIDTPVLHAEMRRNLKGFYGVLKSSDEHLKFVFLTGVTKFSKVSIFSDLNNLTDISLDPRYTDICGITQKELEENFREEINGIAGGDGGAYPAKLKRFYNGYRFSKEPLTVYNPFGLLHHFNSKGEFIPYWFASGTPTFLIKLIEQQKIDATNLEKIELSSDAFDDYQGNNLRAIPVFYQSGYLTITDYDPESMLYTLDYPNDEVRIGFAKALSAAYSGAMPEMQASLVNKMHKMLAAGDANGFVEALKPFYNGIPFDILSRVEYCYQLIFYVIVRMLGIYSRVEVHTAVGSVDAVIEEKDFVYVIEFKLNDTAEAALAQIESKDYALSYNGQGKKVVKLGIEFDKEKRNIGRWVAE